MGNKKLKVKDRILFISLYIILPRLAPYQKQMLDTCVWDCIELRQTELTQGCYALSFSTVQYALHLNYNICLSFCCIWKLMHS